MSEQANTLEVLCPLCGAPMTYERASCEQGTPGLWQDYEVYRCASEKSRCASGQTRAFVPVHNERRSEPC